jgi:cell division control protein 6
VITLCAANAAREHGDARRALDMLRVAGEIAEQDGAEAITVEHARCAFEKIERDTMVEVIKTLPTQSKLVLYSIVLLAERGIRKIITGEVYNAYRILCNRAGVETLTQRRVSDLISELDMLGIVNAMVISKGRFGRTKEITLGLPVLQARAVLQEDYSIGSLEVLTLPKQLTLI